MNSKVIQISTTEKGVTMLCENGDVIFTPILFNGTQILGEPIYIIKTVPDPFIGVDLATGKDETVKRTEHTDCPFCNYNLSVVGTKEEQAKIFDWHLGGHVGDKPQEEYDDGQGRKYDILDEELE